MALVSIGIVGKDNEPLYLCDFTNNGNSEENPALNPEERDDDPFGFFNCSNNNNNNNNNNNDTNSPLSFQNCSLHFQFILHASLDRLEEMTAPGNRWRTPGATGSEAMWVGLLCPVENYRVYGYLTTTNIKMIAVLEDGMGSDHGGGLSYVGGGGAENAVVDVGIGSSNNNSEGGRDSDLKALFAKVHSLYVEYTLNPFTKIKSPIVSKRFDTGVYNSVSVFNGA